jgi:hypothetical protein
MITIKNSITQDVEQLKNAESEEEKASLMATIQASEQDLANKEATYQQDL